MEDTERGSLGRGARDSKEEKERTNQHKRQVMALSYTMYPEQEVGKACLEVRKTMQPPAASEMQDGGRMPACQEGRGMDQIRAETQGERRMQTGLEARDAGWRVLLGVRHCILTYRPPPIN